MAAKFDLRKSDDGHFYFNLKAGNGEVILPGETHISKQSAQEGIASVGMNAALDDHFDRKISADGHPYFSLKGANGQNLGRSEMYSSASAREHGITSVKMNAFRAQIADMTT